MKLKRLRQYLAGLESRTGATSHPHLAGPSSSVSKGSSAAEAGEYLRFRRSDGLWCREERVEAGASPFPLPDSIDCTLDRVEDRVDGSERRRVVFFDLESTGFGLHAVLFMSGFLIYEAGEYRLIQEIAEDVAEEALLVERAADRLRSATEVVVFNGLSYDLPALAKRLDFHRSGPLNRAELPTQDLVHAARRRYRKLLANCRLKTLEEKVLRCVREGIDVPSAEVPNRYLDFRRSGALAQLEPVLYHNRIDLLAMAALYPILTQAPPNPVDGDSTSVSG